MIIFIVLGIIFLTIFVIEKCKKYSLKATLFKTATSVCFVLLALLGLYHNKGQYLGFLALAGLIFGLLGDIFLDFKYVYKEHDKIYTYAGFIVFAVGHIFYILGLHLQYGGFSKNPLYMIIPLCLGLIAGLLILLLEKPMKLQYAKMKPIVFIYGTLLFSTFFTTLSLSIYTEFSYTTLYIFLIGSIFFAVSDLILSGTYFGVGKERPVDITVNAITYYLAQFLIALSIFFVC